MSSRLRKLDLVDFTGGLNLRADAFNLADNEASGLLNVEIDPRGGFFSRRGWARYNTVDVTAGTWDPRHAFVHELGDGTDIVMVTNEGRVWKTSNGTFAKLGNGTGDLVVGAAPHGADFASWGDDLYIACGRSQQGAEWDGFSANATLLTAADTGTWNNDLTTPQMSTMPQAEFVASHAGYLFVANTMEAGLPQPHRLRWSHPNNPKDWRQEDFLDILDGGGPITAIVPFQDHLLIFKPSSVWALYGYDGDSWQLVNVSRTLGASNRQVVTRSEDSVYFVSWPQGVYRITGGTVMEVSAALRPTLTSTHFNAAATNKMWLGWLGQRLWWSAPYDEAAVATDAKTVFVWDPSIGERGAWTAFRSGSGDGLGPFAQGSFGGGSFDLFAACRSTPNIARVEARETADDTCTGTAVGFTTWYITRWLNPQGADLKKSWRRPTFIFRERDGDYTLRVQVFKDYNESNPKRQFDIAVAGADEVARYSATTPPAYNDGSKYGEAPQGSLLQRTVGPGSARAIQLKIVGDPGEKWGIHGISFKYVPRRMR